MHVKLFLMLCLGVMGTSQVAVSQETPEESPPVTTEELAPEAEAEAAPWSPRVELTLRGWGASFDADTSLLREITGLHVNIGDELGLDPGTIPEIRLRWRIASSFAALPCPMNQVYSK